ncbi:sugar phosphate isomerase/epimerase family protein [Ochrobactrum sp. Marseille-Q0166]|uniref:sugar phosphate isomerase/epimerase family protein n=1 Tax=Ochrobactrum sp. Marseille-Q0166 TaxID=2761105 RepID=UPI0032B53A7A
MAENMIPEQRLLGLAHFSAIHLPPVEFVSVAARAGFQSVGLRLFPAFPGAPCYSVPQGSDSARELRLRLDDTGLEIFDIEFVVLDAFFQPLSVLPVLEDAAALGAKRLSVCGEDSDRARLIDNFAALCSVAGDVGMSVDIENMGWRPVRCATDSLDIAKASGAPNAGVLIDALHFFRNGGTVEMLSTFPGELVQHVQLCDVRGGEPDNDKARIQEAREGRFVPGEGELPLNEMVWALNHNPRISVEVPMVQGQNPADHLSALERGARRVMGI